MSESEYTDAQIKFAFQVVGSLIPEMNSYVKRSVNKDGSEELGDFPLRVDFSECLQISIPCTFHHRWEKPFKSTKEINLQHFLEERKNENSD